MKTEATGLVFNAATKPPEQRVNAFTSLFRLRTGSYLCGFQSGTAKHALDSTVRLCRSDDRGETWRELPIRLPMKYQGVPGSLSSGDILELNPGHLLLFTTWFDRRDPAKPLFDPVTEGVLHSKQLVCESTDEGLTWGPWREVPIPNLTGKAACGPGLHWPDGTLAHVFESYKEFDDPKPGRHGAWVAVSRDGGKTFPELVTTGQDPAGKTYFWDQRLCIGKKPGEYYGLYWTHNIAEKRDLSVHFYHGNLTDKPPVVPTPTTIRGQIGAPLLLDDGRLVGFVVDRERPATMKLWASSDGGKTWPERNCLVVYNHDEQAKLTQGAGLKDVDFKEYWNDMGKWSFGHPAIAPLDKDHVLLAWYAGPPGTLSIHWARIAV